MKLTIAKTGVAPEQVRDDWPSYPEMFEAMLAKAGAAFDYRTVDLEAGDMLGEPEPGEGLLVTGSPKGVYEDHAFISPLEEAVRRYASAGAPVVGICFGHQLIARAYGAKVGKSEKGWGVGVHTYSLVGEVPWQSDAGRFSCVVSHQDQVQSLPDGFRRIAGSAFTPFGALLHETLPVLTFQMHPEYDHDFASALMTVRADRIPAERRDLGQATLKLASDRAAMAVWIKEFLEAGAR
ncbi:MAG: type 1 glutamine amidotransferase [Parvularculaceae bacterium]|nr:type 1 glutamine amidotransferase [Parvularculaceae bacterium]